MSETKIVNISAEIEKGGVLLLSLAGLDMADVRTISPLLRTLAGKYKDSIVIPMLENEEGSCDPGVWSAFNTLINSGMFYRYTAGNYKELMERPPFGGGNVFAVVKQDSVRREILGCKPKGVWITFCEISGDRQVVESARIKKAENNTARRRTPAAADEQKKYGGYKNRDTGRPKPHGAKYKVTTTPSFGGIRKIPTSARMDVGACVYDSKGGSYRLMDKKVRNNGAYTYSTDHEGIWAKIYDDEYDSTFFQDKIARMLRNPIRYKGIVWPVDYVVDADGAFRGYILNSYSGEPLQTSVLKKDGIEENFPGWNRINLCNLTLTLLDVINRLHDEGVLFGCLNPAAIRVVDDRTVYFCDTDDYQIEGYPSLSNNISFAAPENIDKKIYLTTEDSENFSVAELVFMVLMCGKTPYLSGNAHVVETIKKMRFPFYVKDYDERNPSARVLPSMWRFMWSHLSKDLKWSFCLTFQKGMTNNPEGKRLYTSRWYTMVKKYKEEISASSDPADLQLYPSTFKRQEGVEFYRCRICGQEHPKFFFDPKYFDEFRVCNTCMEMPSDVSYTCVDCKRTFIYKNRTAIYHKHMREVNEDWHKQKHCPECKRKKEECSKCGRKFPFYEIKGGMCRECRDNTVYAVKTCSVCGRRFNLTYADKQFYDSKGYDYPKKCEDCRRNKNGGGGYGSGSSKRGGFFSGLFGR